METHLQMLSLRDEEDEHVSTTEATKTEQLSPLLPSSSPSSSSSPPHEFSFAVSLEQSSTVKIPEKNSSLAAAVDLSPADEIFFHGHLLPLHSFFSHKPASPRSSTDSLDHCFTLPIDTTTTSSTSDKYHHVQEKSKAFLEQRQGRNGPRGKSKSKSNSFSTLFSLARLRRKESCQTRKRDHDQDDRTRKRKLKLDVIKKYVRLVKPFLVALRSKKGVNHYHHRHHQVHQSAYSFSGNLRMKSKKGFDEYSAPASMIHSPTYSGILVASGSVTPTYYSSTNNYSTVEDLQEAIQAAIAHCKKSNGASEGRTLQPTVLSI